MLAMLATVWHFIVYGIVAAVAVDFAVVVYRNRAAISLAYHGAPPNAASGFIGIPALGLAGVAWDVFKVFVGSARTTATHTTGIIGSVLQFVPAFLAALSNPLAAALVFLLIGGGIGFVKGHGVGYRSAEAKAKPKVAEAIKLANSRADAAIRNAIDAANKRADVAIAAHKCQTPTRRRR